MNEQERAQIEENIRQGKIQESIDYLSHKLSETTDQETIYILLGKAYQKQTNWKEALNNFQLAIDINPNSDAIKMRKMIIDILEFFNKDMFNQ